MKLKAQIGAEQHDVSIERNGKALTAMIDDRSLELEVSEPEPGVYLLKSDGRVFEAAVTPSESGYEVSLHGHRFEVQITDPKRLRGTGTAGDQNSGRAEIRTAMPGKVVRILHQVGDEVHIGEGVIVVEAMKMQNEMKSPKDGTVAEIRTAEGATVGAGDLLVIIE